jgi:branched-chain amino acid transport system ATP-binding protein
VTAADDVRRATPRDERAAGGLLKLREVAVHYGGVKAVDGISLSLDPGLVYGIIGPNGSGKTTLIGAITRLTKLTHGALLFDGRDYTARSPAHLADLRIARTFQTVRLVPDLMVWQNVQLAADARRGDSARRGTRITRVARRQPPTDVREILARMQIDGFWNYYPSELSYGTQRRVEIARAVAMDPLLLLLDEPTAGMNQAERKEIISLMLELKATGLCQLLIEHDVQMMIDTCDYVFAMNQGRLIAEGAPQEVIRNSLVQEAYLGSRWNESA